MLALKEARDDLLLQELELAAIAEELRHTDEQIVEQQQRLIEAIAQDVQILIQRIDLHHLHAPLHPTQKGGALVTVEVVAGSVAQDTGDLAQLVILAAIAHAHRNGMTEAMVTLHVRGNACSDPWQWQDVIGDRGRVAGAAQIQLVQRRVVHCQRQATALLDGRRAQRSIAIGTAHDQADHIAVLVMRHRDEEAVDQAVIAFAFERPQPQHAFFQSYHGIAGRQIKAPGLQPVAILWHKQQARLRTQQLAQTRFIHQLRIAQQQHDRQIGRARNRIEQFGQPRGVETSRTHA